MRPTAAMAVLIGLLAAGQAAAQSHTITAVRHWSVGGVTRVAIQVSGEFQVRGDRIHNPERVYYDIPDTRPQLGQRLFVQEVNEKLLKRLRVAETVPGVTRVVLELGDGVEAMSSQLTNPHRLMIELRRAEAGSAPPANLPAAPEVVLEPAPVITLRVPSAPKLPPGEKPKPYEPEPKVVARAVAKAKAAPVVPAEQPAKIESPAREPVPDSAPEPTPQPAAASATPAATQPLTPATQAAAPAATQPPAPQPAAPAEAKVETAKVEEAPPSVAANVARAKSAHPSSTGQNSLTRALGLKINRVVIDPGHGGENDGATGGKGLVEKDLVLDVSLRLGKLIADRMGAEVIYTRRDDTFVPLEGRTALANEKKADLFLSIHANWSPATAVAGIETYYLNFTDSAEALAVAARENATSQKSVFELRDLIEKISLHDKLGESREFANGVQSSLYQLSSRNIPGVQNRGVRRAPFVVLIGANMPSVLAEIGFLSNPKEEALLKKPDYRQKIAEALFRGVSRYSDGLSHVQVAAK